MMPFLRYGPGHVVALLVVVSAAAAVAVIARRPGARLYVRAVLAFVLAAATLTYLVGEGLRGTLTGWDFLPFHLSDFAIFLAIYALVTLRQRAAELLYFLSLSALFALATPDVERGFADWRTVVFFVTHGATVVSAAALTFGFGLKPQRGSVLRAIVFVNLYALVAAAINAVLGTNFLYLCGKPAQPSLLDYLGEWPWYLLSVELLMAALFTGAYLPFRRHPPRRS